jgi:hypothetical protein
MYAQLYLCILIPGNPFLLRFPYSSKKSCGSSHGCSYIENSADISLDLQNGDQSVLVASGTTRFTRELAMYSIQVK